MIFNNIEDRMCYKDDDRLSELDYKDEYVYDYSVGCRYPSRTFRDGTSVVDFGPMGGKVRYNEFGEEC